MELVSDRLKALGVKLGSEGIGTTSSTRISKETHKSLEDVLPGRLINTPQGNIFLIENIYPDGYCHGTKNLSNSSPIETLDHWLDEASIKDLPLKSFAFIDTETTGLAVASGTFAFLIGVGRFIENRFHLYQLLMQDPIEESAQLAFLEELLAPCDAIVSFNGKSFDIPLLKTRYKTHRWPYPFQEYPHIDLLHLARRLWRDRLSSKTLGNLERQILGCVRTEEDIPGWAIPQIYFEYLATRDPTPLRRVIYHNAVDIVSLAALFNHINYLLENPLSIELEYDADVNALGRFFEDIKNPEMAARIYNRSLADLDDSQIKLSDPVLLDTLMRSALIHKRKLEFEYAIPLWKKAAQIYHLPAYVELAKYYEHRERNYPLAIDFTVAAINAIMRPRENKVPDQLDKQQWFPELEYRLARLKRKHQKSCTVEGQ